MEDFWLKMAEEGLAIVPFIAYQSWNAEGNVDKSTKIGLRFVCVYGDECTVLDDFWLNVDSSTTASETIGETPQEALSKFLEWRKTIVDNTAGEP